MHIYIHTYNMYMHIYTYIKVKLANIVEGDPKASVSIATTPRCMEKELIISLNCTSLSLIHAF